LDSFLRASDFLLQGHDFLLPTPAIKNQQPATLSQVSAIKHQLHDFFLQQPAIKKYLLSYSFRYAPIKPPICLPAN
jgi:hypothetical protein